MIDYAELFENQFNHVQPTVEQMKDVLSDLRLCAGLESGWHDRTAEMIGGEIRAADIFVDNKRNHKHDYRIVQVWGDDTIALRCVTPGCYEPRVDVKQEPRGEKPKWVGPVVPVGGHRG